MKQIQFDSNGIYASDARLLPSLWSAWSRSAVSVPAFVLPVPKESSGQTTRISDRH